MIINKMKPNDPEQFKAVPTLEDVGIGWGVYLHPNKSFSCHYNKAEKTGN